MQILVAFMSFYYLSQRMKSNITVSNCNEQPTRSAITLGKSLSFSIYLIT